MPTSSRSGNCMVYQDISLPIMVRNLPSSFSQGGIESSISSYAFLLPTTYKQIELANQQSRYASSTSVSNAIIGTTVGKNGYLLQNLPILPLLPLPINSHHIEVFMTFIHAPYISIMSMNTPLPLQNNAQIKLLQFTTTSTMSSNVSTTNKAFFILKKLNNLTLTFKLWLTDETFQ